MCVSVRAFGYDAAGCIVRNSGNVSAEMSWPHPVELGPGYGHVAVILRVVAAACKSLLC